MPLEVLLLYRIVLAILFFFHIKLIIVLSRSVKNFVWDFDGDCHFYYVDPSNPRAREILPFSGILFNFFLQRLNILVN